MIFIPFRVGAVRNRAASNVLRRVAISEGPLNTAERGNTKSTSVKQSRPSFNNFLVTVCWILIAAAAHARLSPVPGRDDSARN